MCFFVLTPRSISNLFSFCQIALALLHFFEKTAILEASINKKRKPLHMKTTKKSLSVEALAREIRKVKKSKACAHLTNEQVMAEIRKQYTFSKDKWAAAKKMVEKGTTAPAKATKPMTKASKAPIVTKRDGVTFTYKELTPQEATSMVNEFNALFEDFNLMFDSMFSLANLAMLSSLSKMNMPCAKNGPCKKEAVKKPTPKSAKKN